MASTCSMPSVTAPQTVYWPSRKRASSKQMKNWLSALFGFWARAIEQVPRTCGSSLNSASSRSEEHTSELQSLLRISYAVFCLQQKHTNDDHTTHKCNLQTTEK